MRRKGCERYMEGTQETIYTYQSVTNQQWKILLLVDPSGRHYLTGYQVGTSDSTRTLIPPLRGRMALDHPALSWESVCLASEAFNSTALTFAILNRQLPLLINGVQAMACFSFSRDEIAEGISELIADKVSAYPLELGLVFDEVNDEIYIIAKKPLLDFFKLEELRFMIEVANSLIDPTKIAPFKLDESVWALFEHLQVPDLLLMFNQEPPTNSEWESHWANRYHAAFFKSLLSGTPLLLAIQKAYWSCLKESRP